MKNRIKQFVLILAIITAAAPNVLAASLDVATNYPSPLGEYDQIRLPPRAALTEPCVVGTFYSEEPGNLRFCADGTWNSSMSGVWTQTGQAVYPLDTTPGIHVGIGTGTTHPEFQLTLDQDGGILAKGTLGSGVDLTTSGAGERLIWYPKKAAFLVGSTVGAQWSDINIGNYSSITGGKNNNMPSDMSSRWQYSVISGGEENVSKNHYNTISGGGENTATFFAIGSMAADTHNTISGGFNNRAGGAYGGGAVVSGGRANTVGSDSGVVSGGNANTSGSTGASFGLTSTTVSGGESNFATTTGATVSGGRANQATNYDSTVSGGENNLTVEQSSVVSGGKDNIAGRYATISGGQDNLAGVDEITMSFWGNASTISGGKHNRATGNAAIIAGGESNTASGIYSVVLGGMGNTASGNYSVVGGGEGNVAAGDHSWVGGHNMVLDPAADYTFLWGHEDFPIPPITTPNAFIIYCGNVGIGTLNPTAKLHVAGAIKAALEDLNPNPATPLLYDPNPMSNEIGYDIAELFETTEEVEAGDLLVIDKAVGGKLKKSYSPYDKKVAGAVSFAPAITFEGSQLEVAPAPGKFTKGSKPPVALAGRVICKVTAENGPIQKGDLLTTSSTPGHAMKASDAQKAFGAVVGKALESFSSGPDGQTTGKISILVQLQ